MAVIKRTGDVSLAADTPSRFLAAAGVVRQPGRFTSPNVSRWAWASRTSDVAVEVDAAYAEARIVARMRDGLADEFAAARGDWDAEMRVLEQARRFDDAHPSRDPLYDELHAEQMYGRQYPEAA